MAAQHCDRCLWQREYRRSVRIHMKADGRTIRICVAVRSIVLPLILLTSERGHGNWSGEKASSFVGIFKCHANRMRVRFVTVDQHQSPVSIWTPDGIRRYQRVAVLAFDVHGRGEHLVHAGMMLYPLEVDQVSREI